MSPGQQDIAGGQSIPRRPVGASLSNRSSRQNIDNVNISDTTIDVGLLSPGNERTRLSEVSQSSTCINETEPLAPHGSYVSPRRTRGYTSVPEDPATYEESFDTDPKPHKNVRHAQYEYRWRRSYLFHLQAWAAEVAWCVVALVLLASVVAILRYYEHKPENTLFGYISLNTIIAFVATLCRAAMVIPISEGISQLKWNAFASGPRSLMDLHAFDQASRGPYGSMMLLFRTRGRCVFTPLQSHVGTDHNLPRLLGVSTIAALVVISSLVTSPLTQATIDYNLPSHKEQKTVTVTGIDSLEAYTPELENALSRAALRSMFTQNYKEDEYRPEPRCPAEHCKWDTFTSLDVCAAVHKITHRVEAHINPSNTTSGSITIRGINSRPYTYDYMPRERLIWDSGPAMDESEYPPEVLAGWNHPDIANVSATFLGGLWMLFVPWNAAELERMERARSLEAIQVIWYWCVNEYTVDMKDGRPTPKPKKSAEIPERHDPSKKKPKEERDSKFKVPRYTHDFIGEAFAGGRLGSTVGATNPIRDELFNIFYPGTYHNGKETNDEALKTKQRKDWDSTLVVEKLANAIAIGMGNV